MQECNTFIEAKKLYMQYGSNGYEKILTDKIEHLFVSDPQTTYQDLLSNVYGAFPIDVCSFLSKAKIDGFKQQSVGTYNIQSSNVSTSFSSVSLPPPHLANYDWRFSSHGAKAIIDILRNKKHFSDLKILCLGTPSLAVELIRQKQKNEIVLLDINSSLIDTISEAYSAQSNFKCYVYDVRRQIDNKFENYFDIILCDPPWYLDYYKLFISRACQMLNLEHGTIYISVFPVLARHHAIPDVLHLEKFFHDLSDNTCQIEHVIDIDFKTPPFEEITFQLCGIPVPPDFWRRAEIISLRFSSLNTSLIKTPCTDTDNTTWITYYDSKNNSSFVCNSNPFIKNCNDFQYIETQLRTISRKQIKRENIIIWSHLNKVLVKEAKHE